MSEIFTANNNERINT